MKANPHWRAVLTVFLFLCGLAQGVAPDNWRKVRGAALKAARSESAAERELAFESFRDQDHVEAAELLVKTITSERTDLPVRRSARDVLASFRADECRDFLYGELRSDPDESHLLLEAFAGMRDERGSEIGRLALKAGAAARKEGDPIVAGGLRCLVSAGNLSKNAIASIIKRTGEDHAICIRKAAIDSLLEIRTPEAIDALVGLADDPTLATRAQFLLVRLSGKELGVKKEAWEVWWKDQRGEAPNQAPVSVARADELLAETKAKLAAEALETGKSYETDVSFYGVPIEGKNIVFVMDASSSMRGYPMERLQEECRKMVGQLPETHKFALIFYPKNEHYPSGLEFASKAIKEGAYKFIDKRNVISGTPTTEAMEFAFKEYVASHRVDSIYLISDGRPSNPIPDVLREIDDLNLGNYIAINTIYIGPVRVPVPGEEPEEEGDPGAPPVAPITTGADFLKEVARRHQGIFTIVEVEPN